MFDDMLHVTLLRCAKEVTDTVEVRLKKILKIIKQSMFSVHDLSRTELSNGLPRFNMPLELGIFLGAAAFGNRKQRKKVAIVLDKENYRYQATTSDIAGQDIKVHYNDPKKIIEAVRDFLNTHHYKSYQETLYGSEKIIEHYEKFEQQKPLIAKKLHLNETRLSYIDYVRIIELWQETHIRQSSR